MKFIDAKKKVSRISKQFLGLDLSFRYLFRSKAIHPVAKALRTEAIPIAMTFLSRSLLALGSVLLIHAFVPLLSSLLFQEIPLTNPPLRPHRCYSAQEHSALLSNSKSPPLNPLSSNTNTDPIALPAVATTSLSNLTSLPLDITIETLISVALLCVAIVMGAEELKPISWRVWAGGIEREKLAGGKEKRSEAEILAEMGRGRSEGYDWLERGGRRGFVDIRVSSVFPRVKRGRGLTWEQKHRKEFAEWAKGNGDDKKG